MRGTARSLVVPLEPVFDKKFLRLQPHISTKGKAVKERYPHIAWTSCPACLTAHGQAKRSYYTSRDARRARVMTPSRRLVVYKCPEGYGWHIGHNPWWARTGVTKP